MVVMMVSSDGFCCFWFGMMGRQLMIDCLQLMIRVMLSDGQ